MTGAALIAQSWTIRGDVQGVGYRDAMVAAAKTARVCGFVRNRLDGTVEAFVQGPEEALAQLRTWCLRGPPAARVTAIDVQAATLDPACTFFSHARTL